MEMKSFDERPPEDSLIYVHDIKHDYYFGGIYKHGTIQVIDSDNQAVGKEIITDLSNMEYRTV